MEDMTAFERQLAAELGRMAGPGRRIDALAMVRTVSTQPMKWRFQAMFDATRLAAAAAIVALFGGFLLSGVLTQPRDEQLPAVGASASPTAEVEPTQEATSEPEPAPTDTDSERTDSTPKADLPGLFSPTGSMEKARAGHTATHLLDGRVLIVGGFGSEDSQGSAEAWDSEAGSFSAAGSLVQPRHHGGGHTATLLPDGRVLVVGGFDEDAFGLTSAEVWDPVTASFSPAGTLAEGHAQHTATLLPDGRVLIVGGYRRFQHYAETAEIWHPETESFAPADLLAATRYGHTATLLDDGRVLIAGGEGAAPPAEVWDPVTGSSAPAGSMAAGRFNHTATLLTDGRVLVVGGIGIRQAEVWDPAKASFGPAGSPLVEARRGHTATLLPDGRVLVIGGESGYHLNDTNTLTVHATAEIWDPVTASFSPAGSPLVEARRGHSATLLPDGRVLVVGGADDGDDAMASAEIWGPGDAASVANQTGRTTRESTTIPPIELPAEIPEGIESGTLETPLGPGRWVHVSGHETTFPPGLSGLFSTPDGYVVPEWGGPWWGGGEAKLWRSSDLIAWTSEPLPTETRGGELSWAHDAYWLNVHEPSSLWRSPDTKSWEQVSFEGLAPPGPDGFAWTLRPGRPLTHGGVTIVPFVWATDSWVVVRGLPGADDVQEATLVETAPGVFDIEDWVVGADSRGTFATVRFEQTDDGLRVLDHEDGTELKVLDGVSMEFIKLLTFDVESRFDEIAWQPVPRLAILDGTTLVEVGPPLESEPYRQAYTADDEGFVSITIEPGGLVHMHRSQDGREWHEIDVIGDDAGEPLGHEVHAEDGTVQLWGSGDMWTLTDELAWEPHAPVRLWTDPGFSALGTGWIIGPIDTNPVTGVQDVGPGNTIPQIWFQPAEGEPVPIDITEMSLPASAGDCAPGADPLSPNAIVAGFHEGCGVREAWIITFDDVPA
jgi:hypothetical protein